MAVIVAAVLIGQHAIFVTEIIVYAHREPACTARRLHARKIKFNIIIPKVRSFTYQKYFLYVHDH